MKLSEEIGSFTVKSDEYAGVFNTTLSIVFNKSVFVDVECTLVLECEDGKEDVGIFIRCQDDNSRVGTIKTNFSMNHEIFKLMADETKKNKEMLLSEYKKAYTAILTKLAAQQVAEIYKDI